MAAPRVSLLMPVRDMVDTVSRALGSVLPELQPGDEAIIVDDASTDGTRRLLDEAAAADARVRIVAGRGVGLTAALNDGLSACSGEIIARMDGDDESLPGRIRRAVERLSTSPRLAAVGCAVELFSDQAVSPNMKLYGEWLSSLDTPEKVWLDRLVESPLCHPSTVIRADALRELGGYPAGDFPEDYALWLELLGRGYELVNLPERLFRWRDHPRRATRIDSRYSPRAHLQLKAMYLSRDLPEQVGILGAGRTGLAFSRALKTHGVQTAFFVDVNPKKVGGRIEGAPVHDEKVLRGPDGGHLVCAVGSKGGRSELRAMLADRGYVDGRDFTCVA